MLCSICQLVPATHTLNLDGGVWRVCKDCAWRRYYYQKYAVVAMIEAEEAEKESRNRG